MANGLAYLHENNIVHGDLKASSVLVNESSDHRFRLRLCGLDNFTSSYEKYVKRRYAMASLAPEAMMIFREGASLVLNDPIFSLLHLLLKKQVTQDVLLDWPVVSFGGILETFISLRVQPRFRSNPQAGQPPSNELFLEYLQHLLAKGDSYGEFLEIVRLVQEICTMDPKTAQERCTQLETDQLSSTASPDHKVPVKTLETVMSTYFRHVRAPPPAESSLNTHSLDPSEAALLSVPNIPAYGRKADIWSLALIIECLAKCTFEDYEMVSAIPSFNGITDLIKEIDDPERRFYVNNYIPRVFKHIVDTCLHRSPDKRITADELLYMLANLEEHHYGSTWACNPRGGVTEDEDFKSHRPMLQEIGCSCEYDYSFCSDFLGQGANGYVFKASITKSGSYTGSEKVAVKEIILNNIRIKKMQQNKSWERMNEQWRNLVDLKHPHVVTYHKISVRKLTKGAGIEFLMDYCEGGDLDTLIHQCKTGASSLSIETVINYATQLASGLYYLHENKFIHGDLKPANVFMSRATGDTGNWTLRIGDLDFSVRIRDEASKSERKDLAGTGPYMSPEMVTLTLEKEPELVGFPTDIWSLGCVILDLANCSVGIKERLFYQTVSTAEGIQNTDKTEPKKFSADAFIFKLSQGYHPFVSELINPDIREVIQRCLIPACEDRPTAAMVLEQLRFDANGDL